MSDGAIRELQRAAAAGDVGAAARLVMFNRRLYGDLCRHWLRSKRLWVAPGGKQRVDSFCLYCGVNTDYQPDPIGEPGSFVFWDDCGGEERRAMLAEAVLVRLAIEAGAASDLDTPEMPW